MPSTRALRTPGDVLTWLNSDDTYAPGAFRAAMEYLQAHPEVAMVYGDADYIDSNGKLIGPCVHVEPFNKRRLFHYSDYIVQPTAFFRRSAFDAVGGIDAAIHWAMDYDLWLRIAVAHQIAYLPKLLAHFRWLKDNKTATGGFGRLDEIGRILAKHGLGPPAYIRLERVNLQMQSARAALGQGRIGAAIGSFGQAARTLFASPRAVASMFQPTTWKIIWTGQVLRACAAREEAEAEQSRRNAASG